MEVELVVVEAALAVVAAAEPEAREVAEEKAVVETAPVGMVEAVVVQHPP